jgi:hypothetical protein
METMNSAPGEARGEESDMALWDVLVTTHDDDGKRVSEVLGSFGAEELGDAVADACRRAEEIGGGIQVVRHIRRLQTTPAEGRARVA